MNVVGEDGYLGWIGGCVVDPLREPTDAQVAAMNERTTAIRACLAATDRLPTGSVNTAPFPIAWLTG